MVELGPRHRTSSVSVGLGGDGRAGLLHRGDEVVAFQDEPPGRPGLGSEGVFGHGAVRDVALGVDRRGSPPRSCSPGGSAGRAPRPDGRRSGRASRRGAGEIVSMALRRRRITSHQLSPQAAGSRTCPGGPAIRPARDEAPRCRLGSAGRAARTPSRAAARRRCRRARPSPCRRPGRMPATVCCARR